MNGTTEDHRRLSELFRELADVAVVSELPSIPSSSVVELQRVTDAPLGRRPLRTTAAAAAVVVLLVGGLAVLARRQAPSNFSAQNGQVVVGRVDDFRVGSITPFPQFGFFIVNDEREGLLALATASPSSPANCDGVVELSGYDRRDYGKSVFPIPADAFFVDTCSTRSFDRLGRIVHGPAPSRGMFRYETIVQDGSVSVSTDLMHPGQRMRSVGVDDPAIVRRGIRDHRAIYAEQAIKRVAETLANDEILGSWVIVLGAFHDRSRGSVYVSVLMSDAVAELTIPDTPTGAANEVSIAWLGQDHGHAVARAGTVSGLEIVLEVFPFPDPPQPGEVQIEHFLQLVARALP